MQTKERFYESGRWLWWDHFWQDATAHASCANLPVLHSLPS
jgi:hypothetical protein